MSTLLIVLQAVADFAAFGKMGAAIGAGLATLGAGLGIGKCNGSNCTPT